jgi:glutathione S-transferase
MSRWPVPVLSDIAGFYSASDDETFDKKIAALRAKFMRLEDQLGAGPYFAGDRFSLVDVVFGPVFRYFDTFDQIGDFGILTGLVRVRAWRDVLGQRHSIKSAVTSDYPYLMREFIKRRNSRLSFMMQSLHPIMGHARIRVQVRKTEFSHARDQHMSNADDDNETMWLPVA